MKATINGTNFNRLIGAVRNFASKNADKAQLALIQLHFHKDEQNVEAYAVDGYRAAKEQAACYLVDKDFTVLVAAPPLKANEATTVEIWTDGEYAYILYGDIQFRTKQPGAEPIDIRKIVDENMHRPEMLRIGVNADYMIDALKSLKLTGAARRKAVIIEIKDPMSPIVLRTDEDDPKIVLPVRIRHSEGNERA